MPIGLEGRNDALFLRGGELGKQAAFPHCPDKRLIAHGLHIHSRQAVLCGHADLAADFHRHALAVAREHDNPNAVLVERGNSCGCALLWRIQKSDESHQYHILLIAHIKGARFPNLVFLGDSQHAQTIEIVLCVNLLCQAAMFAVQRANFSSEIRVGADGKHFLHSTFGDELALPRGIFQHDAHAAPGKIEGNFIHMPVFLYQASQAVLFSPLDHRHIDEVFQARLEIAV